MRVFIARIYILQVTGAQRNLLIAKLEIFDINKAGLGNFERCKQKPLHQEIFFPQIRTSHLIRL